MLEYILQQAQPNLSILTLRRIRDYEIILTYYLYEKPAGSVQTLIKLYDILNVNIYTYTDI